MLCDESTGARVLGTVLVQASVPCPAPSYVAYLWLIATPSPDKTGSFLALVACDKNNTAVCAARQQRPVDLFGFRRQFVTCCVA